jgi:GNAT superfamily N-acetyltransferase
VAAELIRETFGWDTPRLQPRDRVVPAIAGERVPEDADLLVTRFWLPGYTGYALVVGCGSYDWLYEIWVRSGYRGQGRGGQLLAAVLDAYGARPLTLTPCPFKDADEPDNGLPLAQLAAWYARHGFEQDEAWPGAMTRQPGVRPG